MKKHIMTITFLITLVLIVNAQYYDNVSILFWDNDNGAEYYSTSQQIYCDYSDNILTALNDIGIDDSKISIIQDSPDKENIMDVSVIFIIMGSRNDQLLNDYDIKMLSKYLDKGGCIYIEGNNAVEYLESNYPEFLHDYFNVTLMESTEGYTDCDTLETLESEFTEKQIFSYPGESDAALSIDVISEWKDTDEPSFFNVLCYNENDKLYKSTAAAYTPPEKAEKPFCTFIQSVSLSAMESADGNAVNSGLMRVEYLKNILKYFGVNRILYVTENEPDNNSYFDFDCVRPEDFQTDIKSLIKYNLICIDEAMKEEFSEKLKQYRKRNGSIMWICRNKSDIHALLNIESQYSTYSVEEMIKSDGILLLGRVGKTYYTSINPFEENSSLNESIITLSSGHFGFTPILKHTADYLNVSYSRNGNKITIVLRNNNNCQCTAEIFRYKRVVETVVVPANASEKIIVEAISGDYSVFSNGIQIAFINYDIIENIPSIKMVGKTIYAICDDDIFRLSVFDVNGREIISNSSIKEIDASMLTVGTYFASLSTQTDVYRKKIVIFR